MKSKSKSVNLKKLSFKSLKRKNLLKPKKKCLFWSASPMREAKCAKVNSEAKLEKLVLKAATTT